MASPFFTSKTFNCDSALGGRSSSSISAAINAMLLVGARTSSELMLGLLVTTTPARIPESVRLSLQ